MEAGILLSSWRYCGGKVVFLGKSPDILSAAPMASTSA